MSVEVKDTTRATESTVLNRYKALVKGLGPGFESSTDICSAAYICSELDGFPRLDDYTFDRGYGIISGSLIQNLPSMFPEVYFEDFPELEADVNKGEILREHEEQHGSIGDIALYLYKRNNEDRSSTRAWESRLSQLETKAQDLEPQIEELNKKLEPAE